MKTNAELMPPDELISEWWKQAQSASIGKYSMAKFIAARTLEYVRNELESATTATPKGDPA
jgi:hypothetical protein